MTCVQVRETGDPCFSLTPPFCTDSPKTASISAASSGLEQRLLLHPVLYPRLDALPFQSLARAAESLLLLPEGFTCLSSILYIFYIFLVCLFMLITDVRIGPVV